MSLFVFGSSNNIARGLINAAARSGKFERVVCGDVFPDLCSRETFLRFRDTLPEADRARVSDVTVNTKDELLRKISEASQVVYCTHAHYLNAPSNLSLINTVANYSKGKRLVAVTPVELDNYLEPNPHDAAIRSENEALHVNPDMTLIKSDLTMGRFSHIISGIYLRRMAAGESSYLTSTNDNPAPIDGEDLALAALAALDNKSAVGKKYFARGEQKVPLADLLSTLERETGVKAKLNGSLLEKVVSPAATDIVRRIILENVYWPSYLNACRFVASYRAINLAHYEGIQTLRPTLKKVGESMAKENFPLTDIRKHSLETRVLRRIVN